MSEFSNLHRIRGRPLLEGGVYFTFPFPNAAFLEGGVYKKVTFKRENTVTIFVLIQIGALSAIPVRCLNLQEFQSKRLMARYGVNIQRFEVAENRKEALDHAHRLSKWTDHCPIISAHGRKLIGSCIMPGVPKKYGQQ